MLGHRPTIRHPRLLQFGSLGIRRPHHDEQPGGLAARAFDDRRQGSKAEIGAHGDGIAAKWAPRAQKGVAIGYRCRLHVAPLGVDDDERPEAPGRVDRAAQHGHSGRPMPLEKGGLRLDASDERRADLGHALAKRRQPLGVIRQPPAFQVLGRGIDPDA